MVQLTGLVGPKIFDVSAIAVSDISEEFWMCGSTDYLVIPKIVVF